MSCGHKRATSMNDWQLLYVAMTFPQSVSAAASAHERAALWRAQPVSAFASSLLMVAFLVAAAFGAAAVTSGTTTSSTYVSKSLAVNWAILVLSLENRSWSEVSSPVRKRRKRRARVEGG
jgi:hypothetical protein